MSEQIVNQSEIKAKVTEIVKLVLEYHNKYEDKYQWILDNISIDENDVLIQLTYGKKYFEISEYVASMCEQSETCRSEEDYEQLYEDTLNEINDECVIKIVGKIISERVKIEVFPLKCEGDYCQCGLGIDITMSIEDATNAKLIFDLIDMLGYTITILI